MKLGCASSPFNQKEFIARERQQRFPEVFLVLGIVLGVSYALVLPPMQAPDEFAHFYRAYTVSKGDCTAPAITVVPSSLRTLVDSFPPHLEETRKVNVVEILQWFRSNSINNEQDFPVSNQAINVYNCVPYLPSGIAIRGGRLFELSPLALMYLARLANLATYLTLTWIALRLLVGFRFLMFVIALMPMTLQQAASISWDAFTFGAAFWLCALVLRLAFEEEILVDRAQQLILTIAVVVNSFCKANIWLVPLVLLIPRRKFGCSKARWLFVGSELTLAALCLSVWQYWNRGNVSLYNAFLAQNGIHPVENLSFVYHHAGLFIEAFGRTVAFHAYDYLAGFVGTLGWYAVAVPMWTVWLYLATLIVASRGSSIDVSRTQRAALLGSVAIAVAWIFVGLWSVDTPQSYVTQIAEGRGHLPGFQGRYLIPFAFPLFVGLSGTSSVIVKRMRRSLLILAVAIPVIASAVALPQVWYTYYVPDIKAVASPALRFENKLVRRPGTTAEDGKIYIIRQGNKHWVLRSEWIVQNGYRWPDDVQVIPAAELDTIPSGSPIE